MKKETPKNLPSVLSDIPSLPIVASRILHIIADDNSSLEDLKRVISMDQSFASRLLKVANSPYYRASNTIADITDAITRIGFTTVQALVFAISLRDLRRPLNKIDLQLWEHSLAVSVASGLIARDAGMSSGEPFVYGLLHDIGKVVLNLSFKKEFAEAIQIVEEQNVPFWKAENKVFGYDHADMGRYVAEQWRLPENLVFVIANHHEPDILDCQETNDLKKKTLIVKAADALCSSMDIGLTHSIEITDKEWQFLKLSTAKKREAISAKITEEYKVYREFIMGPSGH